MTAKPVNFTVGAYVVYPVHGVGKIVGLETQHVADCELQVYVISFDDDRMKLRLPLAKAHSSGLRELSSTTVMDKAFKTLTGKARVKRIMWSRRAQEYELKINSGNPVSIAEVIRDLHRTDKQPEQSYSERQLYQAAIGRLTQELAIIEKIKPEQATERVETFLKAA